MPLRPGALRPSWLIARVLGVMCDVDVDVVIEDVEE
jgi:hypothetical protein